MKGEGYVIVLGGMIGVGKTSYTKLISEHLGSKAFYESVDDNRLLELFYNDKKRYGFALQIYFLNTRFRDIKAAMRHRNNVLDRSIYEDELFARINFEDGNISEPEFDCYVDLLHNMLEEVQTLEDTPKKRPDLFIYLRAEFETIKQRIKKRGRDYEQFDDNPEQAAYMKKLHERYDDWIYNHYDQSDILVIDTDHLDINREADAKRVLNMVDEKLTNLGERTLQYN